MPIILWKQFCIRDGFQSRIQLLHNEQPPKRRVRRVMNFQIFFLRGHLSKHTHTHSLKGDMCMDTLLTVQFAS